MDLRTYLKSAPKGERARLAKAIGKSVDYTYQLSGGHRNPGRETTLRIDAETGGKVTFYDWPAPKIKKTARQTTTA